MSLIERISADLIIFISCLILGLALLFSSESKYQEVFWFPLLIALMGLADFLYLIYLSPSQNKELNK